MLFTKNPSKQSFNDLSVGSASYNLKTDVSHPQIAQKSKITQSKIGRKITMIGDLTGEEDILIDGTLEGSINLEGYTVSIGVQGTVESNIKARSIVAEGSITGNVEAEDIITIKSGSNVHGNLKSHRVQLDDGAHFWGGINMTPTESRPNC